MRAELTLLGLTTQFIFGSDWNYYYSEATQLDKLCMCEWFRSSCHSLSCILPDWTSSRGVWRGWTLRTWWCCPGPPSAPCSVPPSRYRRLSWPLEFLESALTDTGSPCRWWWCRPSRVTWLRCCSPRRSFSCSFFDFVSVDLLCQIDSLTRIPPCHSCLCHLGLSLGTEHRSCCALSLFHYRLLFCSRHHYVSVVYWTLGCHYCTRWSGNGNGHHWWSHCSVYPRACSSWSAARFLSRRPCNGNIMINR